MIDYSGHQPDTVTQGAGLRRDPSAFAQDHRSGTDFQLAGASRGLAREFRQAGACRPRSQDGCAPKSLALTCQRRLNKAFEERMRLIRFALKLGMILAGQKVGMIAQLD